MLFRLVKINLLLLSFSNFLSVYGQQTVTFFTINEAKSYYVSLSEMDSFINSKINDIKHDYMDMLISQRAIEIIDYGDGRVLKLYEKEYASIYVNFPTERDTFNSKIKSTYLYTKTGDLKQDIKLDSGLYKLANGNWRIYRIDRMDSIFNIVQKFAIESNRLNSTFEIFDNNQLIERRSYVNGVLVDSLFRYQNNLIYLLHVRSSNGKLLSSTSFYNYENKAISIYQDYCLNLGLEYGLDKRLKGIFIIQRGEGSAISHKIDEEGKIIHAYPECCDVDNSK